MRALYNFFNEHERRAPAAAIFALAFLLAPCVAARQAHAQTPTTTTETVLTPAPQAPAPSPTASTNSGASAGAAAPTASLTGRVAGEGGEPLSGVPVTVIPMVATGRGARDAQLNSRMTDENGAFKIDGLAHGFYTINVAARGLIPDPNDAPADRAAPLYRAGDSVTVRLVRGGVITGTVTDASGEPIVAMTVRAYMVRDLNGEARQFGGADQTDDRGVYRIYGLRQGVYVVVAHNDTMMNFGPTGASMFEESEAPTFYPSGTRDTATELTVRAGQEVGGIDIRYRRERGRRVTGTVLNAQGKPLDSGASLTLAYANTDLQAGFSFMRPGANAFSFEGVADGEYEIRATGSSGENTASVSAPQRVTVSGADVTGLKLTLSPLAALSGSLVAAPLDENARLSEACKERRSRFLMQEVMLTARRDEANMTKSMAARRAYQPRETAPDGSGAFTFRNLEAGRYRVEVRPADEDWFVRDVQLTAPAAAPTTGTPAAKPPTRDTLQLTAGQEFKGVFARVAEGAAGLAGRLAPATENAPLPPLAQTRIHLVPAEREQADNSLRYYETAPAPDGAFAFKHLAPGRYLILARAVENAATPDAPGRPARWDAAARARVRQEAEAANLVVELQPCQRMADFALRLPPMRN